MMAFLLPIIAGIACLLSFFLLIKDTDEQKKALDNSPDAESKTENSITRSLLIYSVICVLITVLIAVCLPKVYPDNSIWVNIKRVTLLSVIWPVAYIDFRTLRIPNLFVVYGLVCRAVILIFELLLGHKYVWQILLSEAVAAGGLLLAAVLCAVVVKNGIGFGDMKLFIVMGLMLGLDGIWGAVFLALVVSFIIAVYLLITKKKSRKDAIPFGPALVIGTFMSVCLTGV